MKIKNEILQIVAFLIFIINSKNINKLNRGETTLKNVKEVNYLG